MKNTIGWFNTSKIALLATVIMTLGIAAGCAPETAATEPGTTTITTTAPTATTAATTQGGSTVAGELELTLEELAQYNGKNGQPAYVAVDGIIYDVSLVEAWSEGEHNGNLAGNDVTDAIKGRSPHGLSVLENLPKVGRIVE